MSRQTRSIVVFVPGDPQPKQRPRVVRGRAYTPRRTSDYEQRIAAHALQARQEWQRGRDPWPLTGTYYEVRVAFTRDVLTGDSDNVAKSVMDGLRGVLFADDDFRVPSVTVDRGFAGPVGTWITVTEIERPDGAPDLVEHDARREKRRDAKRPAARKPSTAAATAASPWHGRAVLPAKGYRGGT